MADPSADLSGTWQLQPSATTITFRTKAMRVVPVKGSLRATEGTGTLVDGRAEGRVVIDATSLSTGIGMRDKHLRSPDFFDVERYPTIEFELTEAQPGENDRFTITGILRLHGQDHPVTLDASVTTSGDTATVAGTIADLDRRQWGISWAKMGAGVLNQVEVRADLARVPTTS